MTAPQEGWRGPILQHFGAANAKAGRLTVVSDPDALLTDPRLVELLGAAGFELLTYADPVAFRYAFESRFRRHWDRGAAGHLVVLIRTDQGDLNHIPYDILEEARGGGRLLSFSLAGIFPSLAPNVVAELDSEHFDSLAHAIERADLGQLGSNATRDFVLRHVYEIAPELIKQPADLLRVLLRRHSQSRMLPESLDARLIELLLSNPAWQSWPVDRIVRNREAFLGFLAERWPRFLLAQGLEIVPGREPAGQSIPGPLDLPFDHEDVRVYMDNLFAEGLLEPTAAVYPINDGRWFGVGVAGSAASSATGRFSHLLDELSDAIPNPDGASHQEWQDFSLRWGVWSRLRWKTLPDRNAQSETAVVGLVELVQEAFSAWILRHFGPMSTLPYLPLPVLGHHVPHYLAHHLGRGDTEKVALIVLDGMAIDQWRILRDTLNGHHVDEHAIFSWIPTLTPISRQAIFSGRIPLEFASSLRGTHREPHHWSNFWQDRGVPDRAIQYVSPQGDGEPTHSVIERLLNAAEPNVRVLGGVIGFIDQSLHHVGRGTRGLHAVVEEWADSRELAHMVDALLSRGFEVFLTSDHGNVSGQGFGKPNVGVTAQQRGERAHIFEDEGLRNKLSLDYPQAIAWPPIGLPDRYFPLIAPFGFAFLREGTEAVSHGGIALEEVIVPFVRIAEAG